MVKIPWNTSSLEGPQWVRRSLEELGVEFVFGLPGTQNSRIFDELASSAIRVIVPTHELAASFMANGYARVARRPAVLLTIPGPGFSYALSGIAEARLDSAAVLWISVAPRSGGEHRFQLQAIEQSEIARPLVKEIFEIQQTGNIARALASAYELACSGEPGPVLVHLSEEALGGQARWEPAGHGTGEDRPGAGGETEGHEGAGASAAAVAGSGQPEGVGHASDTGQSEPGEGEAESWAEAARRIADSRKLLVLAGQGALGAAAELRSFVQRRRALVLTTTSGRGALPEDHPLSLGWECSGTRTGVLDRLVEESDTVLALGVKFSHNAARGFRWRIPREKLIHVDTSEEVLGANYPAAIEVCAEVGAFLRAVEEEDPTGGDAGVANEASAADGGGPQSEREKAPADDAPASDPEKAPAASAPASPAPGRGWSDEEAARWKQRGRQGSWIDAPEPLLMGEKPERFFQALRNVLPRDGILVSDSGLHQMLCRRWFRVDTPGGLLTPTDFQSMGFGLPAAIGAALAAPSRPVALVVGDGGLLMSGLEMATAAKYGLSLTVIVINDGSYGLIRREQLASTGQASASELVNPLFGDLAHAAHANYLLLGNDLDEELQRAFALEGTTLVEVRAEDSRSLVRLRSKGALKRAVGTRMVKWLKGLLRGG